MKDILAGLLNLPWSATGLILGLISWPYGARVSKSPPALVFNVKSFWWAKISPSKKGVRAITNGHVVSLGPNVLNKDLEHELIHVKQSIRQPFVFPILYQIENFTHGNKNNKYEREAYKLSGSKYFSDEPVLKSKHES